MNNYKLIKSNNRLKLNKPILFKNGKRLASLSMAIVTLFSSVILTSCANRVNSTIKEEKPSINGFHVVDGEDIEKYNTADLRIITMYANDKTEYLFAKEKKDPIPSLDEIKEMFKNIIDLSNYDISDYMYTAKEYELISLNGASYYTIVFSGVVVSDGPDIIINLSLERINLGKELPSYQYMIANVNEGPSNTPTEVREMSMYTKPNGETLTRTGQDFYFGIYNVTDFCNAGDTLTKDEIFNLEYQLRESDERKNTEESNKEAHFL